MSIEMNKRWIIRHDNGSYFERMTGIGPRFTNFLKDARQFDNEVEACYVTLQHSAFSETAVKEINA